MNPAILKAVSDLRAAGCDADADRIVVALSKQDALVPDDSALRLMADAVPYDLHSNIGAASSAERTHFLKLAFAVKQRPLRRDMTMSKEVVELPSMLIQRWRAEAAAHEKRAKELGYGRPLFAHDYEKNAAQKIECAAQLESALSASAETVAGRDDEIRDLILQYGNARAADKGRGSWQEQKDARDASVSTYSKILDHLELRAPPPASCNPATQPASVPDGLTVDIFYLAPGDDTFICEAHGMATIGVLSEIEAEIKENPLDEFQTYGQGNYKLRASYFPGQYGEFGRCEIAPGYELDFIAYTPIATTPEPRT